MSVVKPKIRSKNGIKARASTAERKPPTTQAPAWLVTVITSECVQLAAVTPRMQAISVMPATTPARITLERVRTRCAVMEATRVVTRPARKIGNPPCAITAMARLVQKPTAIPHMLLTSIVPRMGASANVSMKGSTSGPIYSNLWAL